jgi:hypothetical protein
VFLVVQYLVVLLLVLLVLVLVRSFNLQRAHSLIICSDFSPKTPEQKVGLRLLPDFIPEPFDLSFSFDEDSNSSHFGDLAISVSEPPIITVQEEQQCTPVATPTESSCVHHLAAPPFKYECVNPLDLTRSPSIYTTPELYSLSATPLPSSPAWLSRNIQGIENSQAENSLKEPLGNNFSTPSSPAPLIIPPPIPVGYVLPPVPRIVTEDDFTRSHNRRPPSYRSRQSTLTHRPISYSSSVRRHSGVWKSRSPTVVAHSPSSFLRRSRSFSPGSTPYTQDQLLLVDSLPKVRVLHMYFITYLSTFCVSRPLLPLIYYQPLLTSLRSYLPSICSTPVRFGATPLAARILKHIARPATSIFPKTSAAEFYHITRVLHSHSDRNRRLAQLSSSHLTHSHHSPITGSILFLSRICQDVIQSSRKIHGNSRLRRGS